jgi:hypothetical protein
MSVDELDPAKTTPQRALISRRAELAGAIDVLLRSAQRDVLCMQFDLEPLGLSSVAVVDHLERVLASRRDASVRLLVDDARWLDSQAARLRALQRHFAHSLQMRTAIVDDAIGEDAVVVVDDRHVLNLKIGKLVHGDVWLNHPLNARPWTAVFERRWAHAGHDMPVAPLGL